MQTNSLSAVRTCHNLSCFNWSPGKMLKKITENEKLDSSDNYMCSALTVVYFKNYFFYTAKISV